MAVGLGYLFVGRGGLLEPPWSGPDLATIMLSVATLILGAVALLIALLGIWGYSTIQARVNDLAAEAAVKKAEEVARAVIQDWRKTEKFPSLPNASANDMMEEFRKEDGE